MPSGIRGSMQKPSKAKRCDMNQTQELSQASSEGRCGTVRRSDFKMATINLATRT